MMMLMLSLVVLMLLLMLLLLMLLLLILLLRLQLLRLADGYCYRENRWNLARAYLLRLRTKRAQAHMPQRQNGNNYFRMAVAHTNGQHLILNGENTITMIAADTKGHKIDAHVL